MRLAIALTNCQLAASNLTTYNCSDEMSIAECTKPMATESVNSVAYKAYTIYAAHADSLCFYLQSEEFSSRTERSVNALYASTMDATDRLTVLGTQATTLMDAAREVRAEQAAAAEAAFDALR